MYSLLFVKIGVQMQSYLFRMSEIITPTETFVIQIFYQIYGKTQLLTVNYHNGFIWLNQQSEL